MILKIVWRHLKARPFSGVLTLLAISLILTLLGSFWTLVENLSRVQKEHATGTQDKSSLTLFLKPDLKSEELSNLRKDLRKERLFDNIQVISQEDALKELEQKYGETLAKTLSAQSLPTTIKIDLATKSVSHELWQSMVTELKKNPLVLDVDDGRILFSGGTQENIPQTIINWASLLFALVFAIVALLVSHLIRLVFETSRRDIETMKILGASKSWIFWPLLVEGLLYGILGALCSLVLLWFSVRQVLPRIAASILPKSFDVFFLSTSSWLGIVGVAIAASVVGALLTWPLVQSAPRETA
jgi:cell division transport system permease protein